ncbi:ATP-binding protein [Oxalobacteraceae bacterium A2-2]
MLELDVSPPPVAEAPLLPPQARSLRETGLEHQLVLELLAKAMYLGGKTHLPILAGKLRLSINVLREVLDFMVAEQLAEVSWRGESDLDVQYQLTVAGKERAAAWLERNPYVGPAPVPLELYRAAVERQAGQLRPPTADELSEELADDFLPAALQGRLGAALHSGRPLLLHGAPGSGKSTLARKLGGLLQGLVAVPYALVAGRDIIQVHDAAVHLPPMPRQEQQARAVLERRSSDTRWALCRRPLVLLGAELEAATLELRPDAAAGCYQAPPQLKANNGMLVIDDLGRQRIGAAALLQRLALACEQGLDQLAPHGGGNKVELPFRLQLVLATSAAPEDLLDAAALRRLGYRVGLGALGEAEYRGLFRLQCRAAGIACDEGALRHLVAELHGGSGQPLLVSTPREILGRIADFAGYAGQPPRMTVAAVEQAWISMYAGAAPHPDRLAGSLA